MNNQHQNREEDSFYDYFKDSLEEHQLSVDEQCWENINRRIAPKKRPVSMRVLYSGVAAVAAVLLILFFTLKIDSTPEQQVIVHEDRVEVKQENDTKQEVLPKENQKTDVQSIHIAETSGLKKKTIAKNAETKAANTIHKEETSIEKEGVLAPNNEEDVDAKLLAEKKEDEKEKRIEAKKDSLPKKTKIDNLDFYNEKEIPLLASNSNNGGKWGLSASVTGSGSSSSLNQGHLDIKTAPMFADSEAGPMIGSNSISDIKYAPPFSIGVLVRKGFNKTFGIETGVTYSYLSTSYKDVDKQSYSANLKLHYIGVPINLVVNVWDITPHWKLYASAGAMIEKGIRSDFSQQVSETDQKITQSDDIKGVQWSVNASIGASYRFYQEWNMYLEPRVSHYFDNDQPLSIRTEKKTIIGINAGFRYEF